MIVPLLKLWLFRRLLAWLWHQLSFVMAFSPIFLSALLLNRCLDPVVGAKKGYLSMILISYLLLLVVFLLKGLMIVFRQERVWIWVPLFGFLFFFGPLCSILILHATISTIATWLGFQLHPSNYMFCYAFFLFSAYKRYDLLKPSAPLVAIPGFLLGVRIGKRLLKTRTSKRSIRKSSSNLLHGSVIRTSALR